VVADSANGISRELPLDRFLFIPAALDLTLHRHPAGEWILLDARTSLAGDGIGVTSAALSDIHGPIGSGSQPLLVEPRPAAFGIESSAGL
jgi:hypothetical protein